MSALQHDGVFIRQSGGSGNKGDDAIACPAGKMFDGVITICKQGRISTKFVDNEAPDHGCVAGGEHGMRAGQRCDNPTAIDISDKDDRHGGFMGEPHISDIACPEIDFGG